MGAVTPLEAYLNIDDLSRWINVSKGTIYNWVSHGKIPSVKIGGKRMFDPKDIREWLKRQSQD